MSSAVKRLLFAFVFKRRWAYAAIISLYGLGLTAAALKWEGAGMLCGFAGFMGLVMSAEDGALLTNRCVRLLPLSLQEFTLIRWARVFVTPLVLVSVFSLVLLALTDSPQTLAVIALYLVGPCAIPLLTSALKQTQVVAAANIWAGMILLLFAVYDFTQGRLSATFIVINLALLVIGLSYPAWARSIFWRANRFRLPSIRTLRTGYFRQRGVVAMIWLQMRSTAPFLLVAAAFLLVTGLLWPSIYDRLAQTITMTSAVLMCFMWLQNIRLLGQFRALRCLPLSTLSLTLFTIGVTAVPTATIYVIQYCVVAFFFPGQSPVALESLFAMLAIQTLTVPLLLRWHWAWIAGSTYLFFSAQRVVVGIDFSAIPPWIEHRPIEWSMGMVWMLAACAIVGLAWTYFEIRGGRRAYRVQPNEQMASSGVT